MSEPVNPNHPSYDRAIELASEERFDDALAMLAQLSQAQPEVVDFDCLRARLHFDKGEPEQAYAVLDAALERLPTLALHPAHRWSSRGVIAHRYGMLLMTQERLQDALPWLLEAARRNGLASGEWSALFHAGLVQFRLGDYTAAGRQWYDLLYRAPDLGVHDILGLTRDYLDAAQNEQVPPEPQLQLCLARIGLDNPELLGFDEAAGDGLASQIAEHLLVAEPDQPQARRIRAPLRYRAGDFDGTWDDLATYQRQSPDPKAQVRELEWRHQAGEAEPWVRFAVTESGTDAHNYYLAGVALAEFIETVPESRATLTPQLLKTWRIALGRFEQYFATGEGGYDDVDPHIYSLLCHQLAQQLDGDEHRPERISLHEKGIAVSDFIEHWTGLLDALEAGGQHNRVIEVGGEVLNRYPLERAPGSVVWVFSRLVGAWRAIGGSESAAAAGAAVQHMDAQLDALPVEARSEAAHAMAHARAHLAALYATLVGGLDGRDRAEALDEIEMQQRRALQVEDAWLYSEFGQAWRTAGDSDQALPLFEHAIALTEGDPQDQAGPRMQRALIHCERQQFAEAMTDFQACFAARKAWPADAWLQAARAAATLEQRETALAWFEKARALGAAQGKSRALYAQVEDALRATRPKWKFWGV